MRTPSKRKTIRSRPREKGMILAATTIIIIVMLIMAVPFLAKLSTQYRSTDRAQKALSAFNLAEAGVDRAMWEITRPWAYQGEIAWGENQQGKGIIRNFPASDGQIVGNIFILVSAPSGATPDTRIIESTGRIPNLGTSTVNRTVRVNLEKYFKSIWDFGFFADSGVYVRTNVRIDSYDSRDGSYGVNNRGEQGHLGTNNSGDNAIDIDQGTSSRVYGNLAAGVDTDPANLENVINFPPDAMDSDIFVTYDPEGEPGSRQILSAPFEMPSVDFQNLPPRQMFETSYEFSSWVSSDPDPAQPVRSENIGEGLFQGTYAPGMGKHTLTASNSGIYTNFDLGKNCDVTVEGNVAIYVTGLDGSTGTFSMLNGASITIGENASLTLVLGKTTWSQSNNSMINNTTEPENLIILGTDQFTGDMDYKCNSENHAAIYVPRATFTVSNSNIHIYGALVANYFNFPTNINLHYDEALADLTYVKGGIPYWKITSWQESTGSTALLYDNVEVYHEQY